MPHFLVDRFYPVIDCISHRFIIFFRCYQSLLPHIGQDGASFLFIFPRMSNGIVSRGVLGNAGDDSAL